MKRTLLLAVAATAVLASGCVAVPYDDGPRYDNRPVYHDHDGGHRPYGQRDRDRDGVPNRNDRDRDGDGVPNRRDREPNNPNRY